MGWKFGPEPSKKNVLDELILYKSNAYLNTSDASQTAYLYFPRDCEAPWCSNNYKYDHDPKFVEHKNNGHTSSIQILLSSTNKWMKL